jgi:hypothetical protein
VLRGSVCDFSGMLVKVDQARDDLALVDLSNLKRSGCREKYREDLNRETVIWRVGRTGSVHRRGAVRALSGSLGRAICFIAIAIEHEPWHFPGKLNYRDEVLLKTS